MLFIAEGLVPTDSLTDVHHDIVQASFYLHELPELGKIMLARVCVGGFPPAADLRCRLTHAVYVPHTVSAARYKFKNITIHMATF